MRTRTHRKASPTGIPPAVSPSNGNNERDDKVDTKPSAEAKPADVAASPKSSGNEVALTSPAETVDITGNNPDHEDAKDSTSKAQDAIAQSVPVSDGNKREGSVSVGSLEHKAQPDHHEEEQRDELSVSRQSAGLSFPGILSDMLIDDWEYITKQYELVRVPREPNVFDILNAWIATSAGQDESRQESTRQVANGLRECFDASLRTILLYRFEREQYNSLKAASERLKLQFVPSKVYGIEHLIRLLFRIPVILIKLKIPNAIANEILCHCGLLLRFIVANGKALLSVSYEKAEPAYLQKVLTSNVVK